MSKELIDRLDALSKGLDARAAEDSQKLAQLETKVGEIAAGSERALKQLEDSVEQMKKARMDLGLSKKDIAKVSMSRIAKALHERNPEKYAPHEWDLHKALIASRGDAIEARFPDEMQRVMLTTADSTGGFLIPDEVYSTLYANRRAAAVRQQIGVTEIRPTSFPLRVNKQTGSTTAYRRAEGASVSASDIAFGQMTLSPKSVSARTVISQENIMFPQPALDMLIEQDLFRSMDLKKDYDFFLGSGSSTTPIGMTNTTGVTNIASGSGTGAAPTYEKVGLNIPFALRLNNVMNDGTFAYVGHPGHLKLLAKEKNTVTTSGALHYIMPPWSNKMNGEDLPYKWVETTAFQGLGADSGATPMFFGMWSDAFHAEFGGALVKRSDVATDGTYNALTQGFVHIVITTWDDVGVIRPASIVYDNDLDHA